MKSFTHIICLCFFGLFAFCCSAFCQSNLIKLAQGAVEQGDFQQAATYLDQEINNNPANVESYLLYDKIYNLVQLPATASQYCTWGIGMVKSPDDREKLIECRADDLCYLEIFESAIQEYKKLISRNPKNENAHYGLAWTYLCMNDTAMSIAASQNAMKHCKESIRIQGLLVELLTLYDKKGELAKEYKRYESILKKSKTYDEKTMSTNDNICHTRIATHLTMGNYDLMAKYIIDEHVATNSSFTEKRLFNNNVAIEAVIRELDNRKQDILKMPNGNLLYENCLKYIANLYFEAKNLPLAYQYFLLAQNEDIDVNSRLFALSKILVYGKQFDQVEKLFKQEEDRINNNRESLSERLDAQRALKAAFSLFLIMDGKEQAALSSYEEAGDMAGKANLTVIFYRLQQYNKVLDNIEVLLAEKNEPSLLLEKAFVLAKMGRKEEADEIYQTVIAVCDEDDIVASFALASLGDAEKSRQIINKCINEHADSYICYILSAIAESVNNDFQTAANHLKKAIKLDALNSFIYLSDTYLFNEDFLESNEYKEVMEIQDNNRNELHKQLQ